jgi:hypothetical protein
MIPIDFQFMTLPQILQQRSDESKMDPNDFLRQVFYTTLTQANVPPGVAGVSVAEELSNLSFPNSINNIVRQLAGETDTLTNVVNHLIPRARVQASFLLHQTIDRIKEFVDPFLKACQDAGTSPANLHALTNTSEYKNFLQANKHLIGDGFEAVNIHFDSFVRDVQSRFDDYSIMSLMGGSMRILPSWCAFSTQDLNNTPQVALSSVLVLWSLGLNAPVVLFRPNSKLSAVRVVATHWASGERVTKQQYDDYIYRAMVHPVQTFTSSMSPMQIDTSSNVAAYSSPRERVAAVNKEIQESRPVGLCRNLSPEKQALVFYIEEQKDYYDKVVVQVPHNETGQKLGVLACRFSGDDNIGIHSAHVEDLQVTAACSHLINVKDLPRTAGSSRRIQDVIVYPQNDHTIHSFSFGWENVIHDKQTQERCFIVSTETQEYATHRENVLNLRNSARGATRGEATGQNKETRDKLFALSTSKEVVHHSTEAFSYQGVKTVLGCSCMAWGGKMILVSRLAPLFHPFNEDEGSPENFAQWAKLELAATEADGKYYDELVKKTLPECKETAENLEIQHGNLIQNMRVWYQQREGEAKQAAKARVNKALKELSGVIPTPTIVQWDSAKLFTRGGTTPEKLNTYTEEKMSLAIKRQSDLHKYVDELKNSILDGAKPDGRLTTQKRQREFFTEEK